MSSEVAVAEGRVYVKDLSFDHELWDNEMKFYRNELEIFEHRLEQDVVRLSDRQALSELEHFQNQFILHGEVLDIMKHDIHLHESDMSAHDVKNENAMDSSLVIKHIAFRSRMETQRSIYGDLKKEFFAFQGDFIFHKGTKILFFL